MGHGRYRNLHLCNHYHHDIYHQISAGMHLCNRDPETVRVISFVGRPGTIITIIFI